MRKKFFFCLGIVIILFSKPVHANETAPELFPRMAHRTVYDTANNQLFLFGGYTDLFSGSQWKQNLLNDTWVYSSQSWRLINSEGSPSARFDHSMAYDGSRGNIMLFGGFTSNDRSNDLWKFDPDENSWTEIISANSPSVRSSNSLVYDSKFDRLILFGGYGFSDDKLNDLWFYYFANSSWVELELANQPSVRYGHTMVYDKINEITLLFGGNDNGKKNDLWKFDTNVNTWQELYPINSPVKRYWHSASYHQENGEMVVFGGDISTYQAEVLEDIIWVYNTEENNWREIDTEIHPVARKCNTLTYCPDSKTMLMFGGIAIDDYFSDLWSLDSNYEWEEIDYSITDDIISDNNTDDKASFHNYSLLVILVGSFFIVKRKFLK
ncbi:MAG: Kelch repeat-containing protein [Candidatus Kariarchaeaceae archaeon]